jgi:hypothetical protein
MASVGVSCGWTIAKHWDSLTSDERSEFLREYQVRVLAGRDLFTMDATWLAIWQPPERR